MNAHHNVEHIELLQQQHLQPGPTCWKLFVFVMEKLFSHIIMRLSRTKGLYLLLHHWDRLLPEFCFYFYLLLFWGSIIFCSPLRHDSSTWRSFWTPSVISSIIIVVYHPQTPLMSLIFREFTEVSDLYKIPWSHERPCEGCPCKTIWEFSWLYWSF